MRPDQWILALTLAVAAAPAASAETHEVPGDHPTLQAAVDASGAGDTILIGAGVFHERLVVPAGKPGLRLRGKGRETVIDAHPVRSGGFGAALTVGAAAVVIEDLTLRHARSEAEIAAGHGLVVTAPDVRIIGVAALDCDESGFLIEGASARVDDCRAVGCRDGFEVLAADVAIVSSSARGMASTAIYAEGDHLLVEDVDLHRSYGAVEVTGDHFTGIDCRVSSCTAGIDVTGDNAKILGNVVERYNDYALRVTGTGFEIGKNDLRFGFDDGANGIRLHDGAAGLVFGNEIEASLAAGIKIHSDGVILRDNRVLRSGSPDAQAPSILVAGDDVILEQNKIKESRGDGVVVLGLAARLSGNLIKGCVKDGVRVQVTGDGAVLDGNKIVKNGAEGIETSAQGVFVTDNVAKGNRLDVAATEPPLVFAGNLFLTGGPNTEPQIND